MRFGIPALVVLAVFLGASAAQAASCASYATLKSFDAGASTVEVEYKKGRTSKFFPRPEGSPSDSTKIPKGCRGKVTKQTTLVVKSSGGRMTMTQVRSNFEGKMLNDTEDDAWLPSKLNELIAAKTQVVIVVREGMGKDAPLGVTTIYLPITEEEKVEIERIENQAKDT